MLPVLTDNKKEGSPNVSEGCATFTKANKDEVPLFVQRKSAPTILAPCNAPINLHARSPSVFKNPASIPFNTSSPNKIFP